MESEERRRDSRRTKVLRSSQDRPACHGKSENGVERRVLCSEVVGPSADLAAGGTEDNQDQADDCEHDADGPQNGDLHDEPDNEKDDTKRYHEDDLHH